MKSDKSRSSNINYFMCKGELENKSTTFMVELDTSR